MAKPKIRFKGYTDDWEQRKLGETCKLNGRIGFRGYTEKDIVTKEAGGVLTFSPTNIVNNKLTMECKNTYITYEKYDESPEIKISNGDILFVKTGSTLGKSALVTGLEVDASINPQIVVIRVEKESETFMSNVLITHGIMKQVAAVKIGGAVPTMTETELKNLTYFAPAEKEEQKKIGDYFTNLDHLITLHQCKCHLLLKLLHNDWEQRKFGDLVEKYEDPIDTPTDGYMRLGIRSHAKGTFHSYVEKGKELETAKMFRVAANNFIVNITFGWEHAVAITDESDAGKLVSHRFPQYSFENGMIPVFFKYLILDENFKHHLELSSPGGAGRNRVLKLNDMLEYKMKFPCEDEQRKLASYFDDLDHLITLHHRKYIYILKSP